MQRTIKEAQSGADNGAPHGILPRMEWTAVLGIIAVLALVAGMGWALYRMTQGSVQNGFRLLQDNFDRLQNNMILHQKESERFQDEKIRALRTELAAELQNNRRELQTGLLQATQALESKFGGIDNRLDTRLKELTHSVQSNLEANLKEGFLHFSKIQEHLKLAETQLRDLNTIGTSINDLNSLLKLPHLRGGFGEATLERLLNDMLPVDGYELQYRVVPNSTERVDAVIKYPKQVLPIDSKFPREQVLPLFETNDPAALEQARRKLGEIIKTLGKSIKEKYIRPDCGTTDMALLFVPSETLYFEILRNLKLCEDMGKLKVFVVSPNTLAVTLHAISASRNYYEMARGVEKTIGDLRRAKQHFEHFEKRFNEVGTALNKAQTAFHTSATHLSRYAGSITRLAGNDEPEAVGPGKPHEALMASAPPPA